MPYSPLEHGLQALMSFQDDLASQHPNADIQPFNELLQITSEGDTIFADGEEIGLDRDVIYDPENGRLFLSLRREKAMIDVFSNVVEIEPIEDDGVILEDSSGGRVELRPAYH